ncbi:MAG: heme exporter protein CcmD, partial [Pseudomonadota bacterium]
HVPAAYLSLMVYSIMAVASAVGLIWRMKMAHALAAAAAPIGASFTFLALATGSIWGRPMWGTWWEWGDPRLTSELILLFLYFGYMALRNALPERSKADRAAALLVIVGAVNVPIIHYSVEWWSSLHQGSTLLSEGGPAMPASMLVPLLTMIGAFTLYFAGVLCLRLRAEIVGRERNSRWLGEVLQGVRPSALPRLIERALWVVGAAALVALVVVWPDNPGGRVTDPEAGALFLTMSGYGGYVWPSFVLTVLVLIWNVVRPLAARADEAGKAPAAVQERTLA